MQLYSRQSKSTEGAGGVAGRETDTDTQIQIDRDGTTKFPLAKSLAQ